MERSAVRPLPAPWTPRGEEVAVRAAGGILLRQAAHRRLEVAAVHRPGRDDWSLPKGKLERGETYEECARREVLEESGYQCVLGPFAGCTEYLDRRGRPKIVAYWYMDPVSGRSFHEPPLVGDEIDELRWLELTVARRALTHAHDRELLGEVGGEALSQLG
jgi:8-oxo-dGTP diphosphatase